MLKRILYLSVFVALISSCHNDTFELPDVMVDEVVYLTNYPYNSLFPGSWAYVNGGLKGIILYRESDTKFKAYDRACPHIALNQCSVLDGIESTVKTICRCDKMEFLLVTGEPLNGAPVGLKKYRTYYNADSQIVHITN